MKIRSKAKIRVWGEPQQAAFVPLVATEALLAT